MTVKVKDTMILAAQMLGIDETVESYLQGQTTIMGERETEVLLRCFQTVENEIAIDYIPLIDEVEITTATGVISYADFPHSLASILSVTDERGEPVQYHIYAAYLQLEAFKGKVRIVYTYVPTEKTVDGESDFTFGASKRLIAYGMAAEYALITGELTAANAWSVKYKEALAAAQKLPKVGKIQSRRWI